MIQKIVVAAVVLGAVGAYFLMGNTEQANPVSLVPRPAVPSAPLSAAGVDQRTTPQSVDSAQARISGQPTPSLSMPWGRDTQYPTEAQKEELFKAVLQSGVSEKDLKMAEQTRNYLDYKARISTVLTNPGAPVSAEEYGALMTQTGQMAAEHYLTLSEASGVKAKLLETQFSGDVLKQKLAELNTETAATREQLRVAGDPSLRPDALQRKAAEAQVWKEANAMSSFPNGMTKEQYVLSRLKR